MNDNKTDNFIVMAHIGEMLCTIQDQTLQYTMMKAVFEYGTFGKDTHFEDETQCCLWLLIKKSIDDMKSRRENAKTRGRPRKTEPMPAEKIAADELYDVEPLDDVEGALKAVQTSQPATPPATPTEDIPENVEVVKTYCALKKLKMDCEEFFLYYKKNHWRTSNGVKITNWKQAAQMWAQRSFSPSTHNPPRPERALNQSYKTEFERYKAEAEAERAPFIAMQAAHPSDWAICMNERRKTHEYEMYPFSEKAVYDEMVKAGFTAEVKQ